MSQYNIVEARDNVIRGDVSISAALQECPIDGGHAIAPGVIAFMSKG